MTNHGSVILDMEYQLESLVWFRVKELAAPVTQRLWSETSFFIGLNTTGALDTIEDWRSWDLWDFLM